MAWSGHETVTADSDMLRELVEGHRAGQGGVGSGVDVAASLHGGCDSIPARRGVRAHAQRGQAALGRRVCKCVCTFVGLHTRARGSFQGTRGGVAVRGRLLDGGTDPAGRSRCRMCGRTTISTVFSVRYGTTAGGLQALGEWMGAEIFTPEHLHVMKLAKRFGVAYKVSGAGGGDLGLAFGGDHEALARFRKAVAERYDTIELAIDPLGLDVKILSQ